MQWFKITADGVLVKLETEKAYFGENGLDADYSAQKRYESGNTGCRNGKNNILFNGIFLSR